MSVNTDQTLRLIRAKCRHLFSVSGLLAWCCLTACSHTEAIRLSEQSDIGHLNRRVRNTPSSIVFKDYTFIKTPVLNVSDDSMYYSIDGMKRSLPAAGVLHVTVKDHPQGAWDGLWGGVVIGAATGVLVGAAAGVADREDRENSSLCPNCHIFRKIPSCMKVSTPIGAILGALFGAYKGSDFHYDIRMED